MAVIAMTQEMASLGKDVALGVAEALGLQQVPTKWATWSPAACTEEEPDPPHPRGQGEQDREVDRRREDDLDLHRRGGVRPRGQGQRADPRLGATLLLRSVPHIPCIRVCAPLELRVKRLMERLETDDADLARHEIEVDDAARAARMGEHFNVTWETRRSTT